jgi:hypothetical protein
MGHREEERVVLVGTDQRITSGPAAKTAAFKGRIHGCTRTLRRYVRFLLHRGRRPYMAHSRDGGRPSWRPVLGVVLPPLWHQGHKGNLCPGLPRGNYRRTAAEGPRPRWPHRCSPTAQSASQQDRQWAFETPPCLGLYPNGTHNARYHRLRPRVGTTGSRPRVRPFTVAPKTMTSPSSAIRKARWSIRWARISFQISIMCIEDVAGRPLLVDVQLRPGEPLLVSVQLGPSECG